MTRFTLPALGMFAAVAVLLAGAFGDLPMWRQKVPAIVARSSDTPSTAIQTAQAARPLPEIRGVAPPTGETDRTKDDRATIARESQELAALRASADAARRELDVLRERHQREQAELARIEAARTAITNAPAAGPAATQAPARTAVAMPAAASAQRPATDAAAPGVSANVDPAVMRERSLATRRLEAARTALRTGRRARARWLLTTTRNQMTHAPAAFETPNAAEDASPSRHVEDAIGLLNRGDRDGAVQAIERVLVATSDAPRPRD